MIFPRFILFVELLPCHFAFQNQLSAFSKAFFNLAFVFARQFANDFTVIREVCMESKEAKPLAERHYLGLTVESQAQ